MSLPVDLAARPVPRRPPLVKDHRSAWLAGVAAGLAEHLGWPAWVVRVGFILLTGWNLVGLITYGFLWVMMPEPGEPVRAPGIEAATRAGMRTRQAPSRSRNVGAIAAMSLAGLGLVWLIQAAGLGLPPTVFLPVALAVVGVLLVWGRTGEPDAEETAPEGSQWWRPFVSRRTLPSVLRILAGVGLMGTAISIVAVSTIGLEQLPAVLLIALLMMGGAAVLAAPWLHHLQRTLITAREEKLVSDARADMAAHLHDSVLQTLALIQRQAEDPRAVAALARRQERELRGWLYGDLSRDETVRTALERVGAEVEDERGVPIEVVCVGDAELSEPLQALIGAAREAMLNAAKHSGADSIDVYAEVAEGLVEVFVRDRGAGFEVEEIGEDRLGVRRSIIDRMDRHGGVARIRSRPGEGTEVRLEMGI